MGRLIPPSIHGDIDEIPQTILDTCRFKDIDVENIDGYLEMLRENYHFIPKNVYKLPEMTRIVLKDWRFSLMCVTNPIVIPTRKRFIVYKIEKFFDCLISDLIYISSEVCILDKDKKILYHFPTNDDIK